MPDSYRLRIITQERVYLDQPTYSLRAPGLEGYFGVRPGHAPMVAALGHGRLTVTPLGGGQREFDCDGGTLEVSREEGVLVLADAIRQRDA